MVLCLALALLRTLFPKLRVSILTVLSENAELKALLTSMNERMEAMSESLRGSGEKPTPKPADSAKRGRKTNNHSLSDSAESDADQLLESNKRQKIQDGDEEEDTLLDEIVRSMNETEKTDAKSRRSS